MPRTPRTRDEEFFRAMNLAAAGKHARAIEVYTALIEKYPDFDRRYFESGSAGWRKRLRCSQRSSRTFRRATAAG
jgi:hypothetical protein